MEAETVLYLYCRSSTLRGPSEPSGMREWLMVGWGVANRGRLL